MRFLISMIVFVCFSTVSLAEDQPLTRDNFSFTSLNRLNFNFSDGHQIFKPIEVPKPAEPVKITPKTPIIENDPTKPYWIAEKGGEDRLRKENGLWKQKCWDGTGEWVYSPSNNSWRKESYQPQFIPQQFIPLQIVPSSGSSCPGGVCPLPTSTKSRIR
jgi:hypothetical protein